MKEAISASILRGDAAEKCSGRAVYIADLSFPGLLYARVLRSARPHARITDIHLPQLPEMYTAVGRHDVPGRNRVKMLFDDQPFFADEIVRYIGEPILLLAGPDKNVLDRLLSETIVEYQDLEPEFSAEKGLEAPERVFVDYSVTRGDPRAAFASASEVVEETFETGIQEQLYMETQGVTAVYENGRVSVYGSMQCPYYVKNALIQAFGWPEDRIRVVGMTTGGGFGGKEDYPSIIAGQAAAASYKTERPVCLVLDRDEDMRVSPKRHASRIKLTAGLSGTGQIIALKADILLDAGAYTGLSSVVLQRALFAVTGVYDIPNAEARGRAVLTNNLPAGCFRGFGAPQAFFAVEMFMEHLARRAGTRPDLYRLRHIVKQGSSTFTGGTFHDPVLLDALLEKTLAASGYREKHAAGIAASGAGTANKRRGVGLSLYLHGCGFTGSGERDIIKARARLEKKGGAVFIRVANVEMGQGAATSLRKIVADSLDISIENVVWENPDTDVVPDSGPTVASRTVMIVGMLLKRAAEKLRGTWDTEKDEVAEESYQHPEYIVWDQDRLQGDAYQAYSWGASVVEVEADVSTGEIQVEKVWTFHDIGTAIDERIVRGQVEGGFVQGLGYAGQEVMETKNGLFRQSTLTDYCIPTSVDIPVIESGLLDNPFAYGPYGAKGAGELPIIGAAPAYAAAVENAFGLAIRKIPVRPEDLISSTAPADKKGDAEA